MKNLYRVILKCKDIGLVCIFLIAIFIFSNEVSIGFKKGIILCSDILIPSLFPFMTISSFITCYGIFSKLDRFFSPVTKFLFNLPGCTVSTIFLGLIGGYPSGAIGISNLLESGLISKKQAERMLLFLVNSGPAFVITAIGSILLHNKNLGKIMFLSQTMAAVLLGFLSKFFLKEKFYEISLDKDVKKLGFSDAFVKSVKDSTQNIFNMCAFVVLFSSFTEIIKNEIVLKIFISLFNIFKIDINMGISVIFSIFEVTTGCSYLCSNRFSLGILMFFLSFAGVCVHMQIFSCFKRDFKFSKFKFILFRILHGLISVVIFYLFIPFFNQSVETFNISTDSLECNFSLSGISIIFLCLCFLNTFTSSEISFEER